MDEFYKYSQIHMQQVCLSLGKAYHHILANLLGEIEIGPKNMIMVTKSNVVKWHGVNNQHIVGTFRARLSDIGFWVKTARGKFMINPTILNKCDQKTSKILYKIYLANGGFRLKFSSFLAKDEKTAMVRCSENKLELEFKNAMNASLVKRYEKEERQNMRLEKEMKELKLDVKKILALMTPKQIEKVPQHLKLVK